MTTNTETTVNHPPLPLAPVDTSVVIPRSVREASERAAAIHQQAYTPEPQPSPQPQPVVPEPQPSPQPQPVVPEPQPQPVVPDPVPVPSREELQTDDWAGRYNSMRGRYEQSQRTIGELQEQCTQLGDELVRTQQHFRQPPQQQREALQPQPLLTKDDQDTYGDEMIDFATRAARAAVLPELTALQRENQTLKRQVGNTTRLTVNQQLDTLVPTWHDINAKPEWITWLRKRDVYSGEVRQELLDKATRAADAPRIAEFFKGFLSEGAATGAHSDPQLPTPQPRQAAVPLESLAAPGRARPATGDTGVPVEKPVFTRLQISQFYANVRRGVYAGRDTDKVRDEQAIFLAQREGRVR